MLYISPRQAKQQHLMPKGGRKNEAREPETEDGQGAE